LKKIYFSLQKLFKQQSTSFWSQRILGVKYSKESTKTLYLLKIGNKVVEVDEYTVKIEDNNSMRRDNSGKQIA
jgi:hypothetical protein